MIQNLAIWANFTSEFNSKKYIDNYAIKYLGSQEVELCLQNQLYYLVKTTENMHT